MRLRRVSNHSVHFSWPTIAEISQIEKFYLLPTKFSKKFITSSRKERDYRLT